MKSLHTRGKLEIVIHRHNLEFNKKKPIYKGQKFIKVLHVGIKQEKKKTVKYHIKVPYNES